MSAASTASTTAKTFASHVMMTSSDGNISTLLDICLGNSPVKVKHSFGHSSGMVGLMNMKRKVHQLGTGYMMWSWPLTSLMTLTLGFFKVKFRNSSISGIVDLSDVKWKGSEFTIYWANYMTFPFDHTHDLGLDHSWTWTWYWLLCYHGGWMDVPDNDWGEFRLSHI